MTARNEASLAPERWAPVRLADIAEVRLGRQRSPDRATGPNLRPYLRAGNVTWGGFDLSEVYEMDFAPDEQDVYRLLPNDILLNEASGSASEVGKPAIWDGRLRDVCFQNTLLRVRAPQELVRFLYWRFLHDARGGAFAAASRGVGIHHLSSGGLSEWHLALPPVEEQVRLADTLDEQFSRLDAAEALLKNAQARLERLRASILQAAVTGRLVPTEAEFARRERRSFEPASVLLDRILAERRRRWETSGRRGKYEEPAAPDSSSLPPLPEGWCWATLWQLAETVGGLTKNPERDDGRVRRSIPYLRVANVHRGRLDLDEIKLIPATEDQIRALRLFPGDILLNEGGDRDKLGRGWVWRGEIAECIHQNHVFRSRLVSSALQPEYVSWYANTRGAEYFAAEGKQTTNLASISLSRLRKLPVPLPPASEQERIVNRLSELLSEVDATSGQVRSSNARLSALRRSILRLAFSGGLVDPDPNDEPASVLLERIRASRANPAPRSTKRTS